MNDKKELVLHQLRYAFGLKNLAPIFYPIRNETKTNSDLLAYVFPRAALRAWPAKRAGKMQPVDLNLVFDWLLKFSKLTSVFHASVLLLIMNFVSDSRVDPQTALTMLWRNSLSITGQTHKKLTPIWFLREQIVKLSALARCCITQIHVSFRLLTIKISPRARENFGSYRKKLVCSLLLFDTMKMPVLFFQQFWVCLYKKVLTTA